MLLSSTGFSVTPAGVFALSYVLALRTGGQAAGILTVYIAIVCGLLLLFTLLLYPVTAVLGRTTMRTFARAAAPAQLVAVSTRSSVAALPALIEGGRTHLRLPAPFTGFVLPLSVSLFKVNRTISSLVKLFFLAHVYGISLRPAAIATFLAIETILSFGTAGVPLGGMSLKGLAGLPRGRRPRRRRPDPGSRGDGSGHLQDALECHGSDERGHAALPVEPRVEGLGGRRGFSPTGGGRHRVRG